MVACALALADAPAAGAAVPSAATITNAVVTQPGAASLGTPTFRTTFTDTAGRRDPGPAAPRARPDLPPAHVCVIQGARGGAAIRVRDR